LVWYPFVPFCGGNRWTTTQRKREGENSDQLFSEGVFVCMILSPQEEGPIGNEFGTEAKIGNEGWKLEKTCGFSTYLPCLL